MMDASQIVVAIQMVVEEKFVAQYDVHPLEGVGWEGLFGLCMMSTVLIVMYYLPGTSAGNHLESSPEAFLQYVSSNKHASHDIVSP